MAIETLREQVTKVLHIWQAWSLFPPSLTARLERYFLNGKDAQQQQPQTSSSSSSAIAAKATASAGSTASKADDSDEDVDGEPMTTDEYGQPLPPALLQKAQADYAAHALTAKENKVRGLNLRELESVCEASGLSSAGSRAEMQTRILLALRAGAPIDLDPNNKAQTLAVASRWDKDEDDGGGGGDGGPGSAASNAPVASPKAATSSNKAQAAAAVEEEDIDGEAIDGEDLDGEAIDGSPLNPPKHNAKEQQMINAAKERLDNRGGNRDRDVESRVRDARDRDRPRSRSRERDRGGGGSRPPPPPPRGRSPPRDRSRRSRSRSRSRERGRR